MCVIEAAIENETEDDHLHITGEYYCGSTSAVLRPPQGEHRTRSNAEKRQRSVAQYGMAVSEKTP